MSRSRLLGLFALPVLVASAAAFPQDVSGDFADAIDLWGRDRKQEALDAMRRLLASDPEPASVFEVYLSLDDTGLRNLRDFMAEGDEYTRVASRFMDRARAGRVSLQNDEARIAELVRGYFGSDSAEERIDMMARIESQHGEYAVPRFVNALADDRDPDRSALAVLGARRIGSRAVQPLLAAMASDNAYLRRNIALTLGQIGDPRAGAALLAASMTDEDENVRGAAATAAQLCGVSGDPTALFIQQGDDLHHRRGNVLRDADYSDVLWSWDGSGIVSNPVPNAVYNNELAKAAYYSALALDPTSMDAAAGIARESVDIQSKVANLAAAGVDVSDLEAAAGEGMLAVLSAGPAALDRALGWSVQSGDSATGSRIAQHLGHLASAPTEGLLAALAGGGAAMSGEAAVSLAHIAVNSGSMATGDVVAELGKAAGRRVVKVAVVIDADGQRASGMQSALDGQGVSAQHFGNGAAGLVALGQLNKVDVILVGDELNDITTDAVVARVRQNPAFASTPIFLLSSDEELAGAYGDRIQGSFAGADGIDALQEVFDAQLDDGRARADALAGRASGAISALAASGSDVSSAMGGLMAAIDGRRDGVAIPALNALATVGGADAVDGILAVLEGEGSDEVRMAAASAIGSIGGRLDLAEGVSDALRSVLGGDGSLELRSAAASALGRMRLGAPSRAGVLEDVRVSVGR